MLLMLLMFWYVGDILWYVKFVLLLHNLSVGVEIRILKALKFSGGKFWPYSTGFLSYDLQHRVFWVRTFLHGGIEKIQYERELWVDRQRHVEVFWRLGASHTCLQTKSSRPKQPCPSSCLNTVSSGTLFFRESYHAFVHLSACKEVEVDAGDQRSAKGRLTSAISVALLDFLIPFHKTSISAWRMANIWFGIWTRNKKQKARRGYEWGESRLNLR